MSASESRKAGDWALPYKGLAATSASGTTCARAIAGRSVGCREHGGNRRRHEDGMWRMALRDGCCGTVAVVLSMDNQEWPVQTMYRKQAKQVTLDQEPVIFMHKPSDFSCIVASSWLTNSVLKTFSIRHPLLGSSREYRKRYGYEDDMLKKHHRRQLHPSPRHGEDVTPKSCGERAVTQLQPPLALLPG
ncbi:uncharacterized protein [Triticum aestivum]|uniref:uncharacterized protein n=1 Tax=Triticum aestivum TaxID=4565 RepID=UPI001D028AF0|nr:uncharacterized protein LOC123183143 [Triticum aestivum]